MSKILPNAVYTVNGVTVNEKIIPDGTRWRNAVKAAKCGFIAGSLYKKQRKLNKDSGKPEFVTIHNTDDLKGVEDDCEQYTRATYNENMKSVRVHFYVDDLGAWQNLRAGTGMCENDPLGSAEVSWHSSDGSVPDGGNMMSLSIEVIMNDCPEHDEKAYDNSARLAAWLLYRHGLTTDRLVTHTYWVNKAIGKAFDDVDEQCTSLVKNKKWCPKYIFASTEHSAALRNWKMYKDRVNKYLSELGEYDASYRSDDGLYRVMVGKFGSIECACTLLRSLKTDGFDCRAVNIGGSYSVQIGAYSVRKNADTVAAKLKGLGYDAEISLF